MSRTQIALYITVVVLSFVVFLSFVIYSFFVPKEQKVIPVPSGSSNNRPGGFPSPPPQVIDSFGKEQHPNGNFKQQTITPENQRKIEQDEKIGQLIKKLPYYSPGYVLRYDFETNAFTVSFNQDNLDQANRAFEQFLRDNGIGDRSWLYNLSVKKMTY